MNIEKDLVKDGIIVTEKIDTDIILNITQNISKKIVNTFRQNIRQPKLPLYKKKEEYEKQKKLFHPL